MSNNILLISGLLGVSELKLLYRIIYPLKLTEQAGSAVNLRYILEWAWDKVVKTKEELDGICKSSNSRNFYLTTRVILHTSFS